jgi:hypothetical protein
LAPCNKKKYKLHKAKISFVFALSTPAFNFLRLAKKGENGPDESSRRVADARARDESTHTEHALISSVSGRLTRLRAGERDRDPGAIRTLSLPDGSERRRMHASPAAAAAAAAAGISTGSKGGRRLRTSPAAGARPTLWCASECVLRVCSQQHREQKIKSASSVCVESAD